MSFVCYRDAWGIPHLRAPDLNALAFAQGWNAAVDRAWQIETARRRASGTASALLGERWIDYDRLVRQVRVADTAIAAFDALDADTAGWLTAYVAGVNAGLAKGAAIAPEFGSGSEAVPLPWEPWTPLAIWHAEHLLFGAGFPAKLWRERVRDALGEEAVDRFAMDGPEPVGSNGWLVDGTMTASGSPILAGDPHRFIQLPGSYQQIRLACDEFDVIGLAIPGVPGIAHFGHTGTVAWGITNAMADTQDLYRERLRRNSDGSVQAFGPDGWEPTFTRTEAFTVAGGPDQTVEVIETARGPIVAGSPGGPGSAERVENGSGAAEALSLRGPVQVLPDLGFAALPRLLRANTVADVDAALHDWVLPVNVVMAADTRGGLLHRTAGRVPERDAANVRHPVPAWDPRYAWRGWKRMPRKRIDRLAVMANDADLAAPLGVEFCPPHRADRIRSLLESLPSGNTEVQPARNDEAPSGAAIHASSTIPSISETETRPGWTAADMAAIHTDTLLTTAGVLLDLLPALNLGNDAASVRKALLAWDRRMDSGSAEAALFAAVRAELVRNLEALPQFRALAEPADLSPVFAPWLAVRPRIGFALEHVLAWIDPADRDNALRRAVEECAAEQPVAWGEVHRLAPWQDLPFDGGTPAEMRDDERPDRAADTPGAEPPEGASAAGEDRGPETEPGTPEEPGLLTGMSGDADCVLSTSGIPGVTEDFTRGPAARWVWDLADRAQSRWIVPFGASGLPGPHHRDQFPLWRRGELAPVVTDWHLLQQEYRMIDRPAVFETDVEGFGTVAVVPVRPAEDLDLIYGWVTQERARFWGMTGHSRDHVLEIYEYLDALTTHHAYLLLRNGEPIALFQTYEPDADPVGECYEVEPGDIGAHLLVAAAEGRAQVGFTAALMGVLAAYLFSDPEHQRIVAEPDARNDQARARLRRTGFTLGPEIQLPDKTAQLSFLRREDATCNLL
ncbi:GNAT family N-acetyltransferase [Glycomyces harbinensis]|uniref:Lysine N-acyltransferase MbtK n=1 Tax=Glycomyces harbinensis TaxID=58114 RepID=A0A1G7DXA2_9ACTN|nr:GNAT family N-acetyltransferase [Glycomyces harbinensis]SDE56114.1 penicillin amidase [Glycomyces harbinensis]